MPRALAVCECGLRGARGCGCRERGEECGRRGLFWEEGGEVGACCGGGGGGGVKWQGEGKGGVLVV